MNENTKSYVIRHQNPEALVYQFFWGLMDLIYPPLCIGCNEVGTYICEACTPEIRVMGDPGCIICGAPVVSLKPLCSCDQKDETNFRLRSWAVYRGSIRRAIHRMKYEKDIGLTYYFSKIMAKRFDELNWDIDLVVPVPLSRERLQERGYNQSSLLARPFARMIKKNFSNRAIARIRNTASQVDLDAKERVLNVVNAFHASTALVSAKKILIIDDLATTCATIAECSNALINAGAAKVFALTLARTVQYKQGVKNGDECSNFYPKP